MEGTITAARRKQLVAAHMSHHVIHQDNVLNVDWQHKKAELEGWAYEMSWDCDAKDINLDEGANNPQNTRGQGSVNCRDQTGGW